MPWASVNVRRGLLRLMMSASERHQCQAARLSFAAYTGMPSDHIQHTVRGLDHVEQPHSVLLQLFLVLLLSHSGTA